MTDSSSPTNTTAAMDGPEALLFLASAMGDENPGDSILAMEAQGASEMLRATTLPSEILYATPEDFEALGFVFGDLVDGDPLFRHAELPAGWAKQPTGHSMWTDIVDDRGLPVGAIFYKAAFYDRKAHLSLTKPWSGWAGDVRYGDAPVALPDKIELFTLDEVAAARADLHDSLSQFDGVIHESCSEKAKAAAVEMDAATRDRINAAIELLDQHVAGR